MSYVAHQYSRVDFYSSLEVNLSLYYGGVTIRYESDDVIWLRNHAYTWMLVPNIECKQTMASNFFWCSHIFFSDYPKAIRRGEISFKSNHVTERNFEAANSIVTGTSSGHAAIKTVLMSG